LHIIKLVGAGQLGSRHLQALKAIDRPLEIHVVDPSAPSLATARERYEGIGGNAGHKLNYSATVPATGPVDIAIVPTSAAVRRAAIEALLAASPVKYMVLEKLLFVEPGDYQAVSNLLRDKGVRAWVNCPMRVMPVYEAIRASLGQGPVHYRVTGSQFGLVTNAIHYLDHVVHLSGCNEFELDTSGLEERAIDSKRAGYLEYNGTLSARFADGSRCDMTCYPQGNAPVVVEISTPSARFIVRESEGRLWRSTEAAAWKWEEDAAPIPFQSQMTAGIVESLLGRGTCGLSPFEASVQTHRLLLEPLLRHLKKSVPDAKSYQFT
jgi:predicted dehydrogenase